MITQSCSLPLAPPTTPCNQSHPISCSGGKQQAIVRTRGIGMAWRNSGNPVICGNKFKPQSDNCAVGTCFSAAPKPNPNRYQTTPLPVERGLACQPRRHLFRGFGRRRHRHTLWMCTCDNPRPPGGPSALVNPVASLQAGSSSGILPNRLQSVHLGVTGSILWLMLFLQNCILNTALRRKCDLKKILRYLLAHPW